MENESNNKNIINEEIEKLLNEDETVKEIARIASGNITETTLLHAKELRKKNIA